MLTVAAANASPDFREVYGLVRSNLAGADQEQLDEAAVNGLMRQFPGRVVIVDKEEALESRHAAGPLSKYSIFNGSFAYFRVTEVTPDLPQDLRHAWQELTATNKSKIKGIALDLRFADGTDYTAAGAAADAFINAGEPLLEWPGGSIASTNKENAIPAPVVVLVNAKTRGASEAFAAILRAADRALTIGGKTAGQASIFKEFPLATGQKVRIATADVKLAGGPSLAGGLTPDIPVDTTLAEDKAYMSDPYKQVRLAGSDSDSQTNSMETVTNAPEPRFNEAELVREHRAGINPGEDLIGASSSLTNEPPSLADPSLSRALDVLKGLSVMNGGKPS